MKKIKTVAPLFPGFYYSILEMETSNEVEYINEIREEKGLDEITDMDCIFDYQEYNNEVGSKWTERTEEIFTDALNEFIGEIGGMGISFIFSHIQSPKYYNFETDLCCIDVEVDDNVIKVMNEYLIKNRDNFATYLKDNYKSRDGFISFHSYDVDEWLQILNNIEEDNADHYHKFGAIIEFILINYGVDYCDDIYNYIDMPFVGACNFDELTN